jgi:hypothetical protein
MYDTPKMALSAVYSVYCSVADQQRKGENQSDQQFDQVQTPVDFCKGEYERST